MLLLVQWAVMVSICSPTQKTNPEYKVYKI